MIHRNNAVYRLEVLSVHQPNDMTHIEATVTLPNHPGELRPMDLSGLELRDQATPSHHRLRIPHGVILDIPSESPLSTIKFTDGSLGMDELKQLLLVADGFHLPAECPVVLTFAQDGAISVSVHDTVSQQLLQYFVETHPQDIVIHHDFSNPTVFNGSSPMPENALLRSPTLPITLVEPSIDA